MIRHYLGAIEYQVLSVLLRHPRDTYGATLHQRLAETTRRDISIGALYTTPDRMEQKGPVSSWWG